MRRHGFSLAILPLLFSIFVIPTTAVAQEDDAAIRRQAEQILAEPEFRYFEHFGEDADRPPRRASSRNWLNFGSDGEGDGEPGAGGKGKRRGSSKSGGRQSEKRKPTSSDSGEDSDSSSFPWNSGASSLGNAAGLLFHALAYLVLIAVCGLIVYLIVQAVLNRESTSQTVAAGMLNVDMPLDEEHSPGELPADAYLAQARALAERKQYREAVAQLLLGGMSHIERAGMIRPRRGLTFRDYLRSLRGRSPQYDGFRAMIGLYEPVGFGRRIASFQTFQEALSGYEQAVLALN